MIGKRILALQARRSGATWTQIGRQLGVSKQRAAQLGAEAQAAEQLSGPETELSTRVRNALINEWCVVSPPAVAAHFKSLTQLRRVPNLGTKAIAELQAWLIKHGEKPIT